MADGTEISPVGSLVASLAGIAAALILLWNFGIMGTLAGFVGTLFVALSLLDRREQSPAWMRIRIALALAGVALLAAGGWLDFEGWRFARQ